MTTRGVSSAAFASLTALVCATTTAGRPGIQAYRFSRADFAAVEVSPRLRAALGALEYPEAEIRMTGLRADLNGDGRIDAFLASAEHLCGATGNCPLVLVDGATDRVIADLFGTTFVLRARDAWPLLESWSNEGSGRGRHAAYVHDGSRYKLGSNRERSGKAAVDLLTTWRTLPRLPPS